MSIQTLLLIWLGYSALALGMPRHQQALLPKHRLPSRIAQGVKVIGLGLLGVSGWWAVETSSLGIGLVAWTGLLTLALVTFNVVLTYRPILILASTGFAMVGLIYVLI